MYITAYFPDPIIIEQVFISFCIGRMKKILLICFSVILVFRSASSCFAIADSKTNILKSTDSYQTSVDENQNEMEDSVQVGFLRLFGFSLLLFWIIFVLKQKQSIFRVKQPHKH